MRRVLAVAFGCLWLLFRPSLAGALTASLILEHDQASAWTDLLKEGLQKAAADFGVEARVVIASPDGDQAAVFRETAEKSDLVLVASENLFEILRDNAANFRRVKFGVIDAGIRAANIMSVTFRDEQAAFLAGACAAMLTMAEGMTGINSQKTVGWLAGEDTHAMRSLFNGFAEGARLVDGDVRIAQAVVGSFANPGLAAKKAGDILAAGADVVVLAAGAGNDAARQVVLEAGAWPIELDKNSSAQKNAGTITKAADRAVYEIVESAAKGNFRAKEIVAYDLGNGGVGFKGHENAGKSRGAPSGLARRLKELGSELEKGSIYIKSQRQRTLCDCLD